jgi:hypothetical protein
MRQKFSALVAVLAIVATLALVMVGGDYDYSGLIVAGTLLTDLALMISAALAIAVGFKFAFIGARAFGRAVKLIH